jgi:hypothetical protein
MSSVDTITNDPNTIFLNNLKTTIMSISSMILISSVLSYLTIIIKSLHNPSFDTNLDYNTDDTTEINKQNKVVDILKIITKTTDFWSRIQIKHNMFNPAKWIKPSEVIESYSLLYSVERIITQETNDSTPYFNHFYKALIAIPLLKELYSYFNSPHIGVTPPLNTDLNGIYKPDEPEQRLLQWDTTISEYIIYYIYSVMSQSVNTNLYIYHKLISYISDWNETTLFLIYTLLGYFIMYGMGIVSTIVLLITSVSEIPKLFSDRMPIQQYRDNESPKINIEWSVNSLQFINPFRLFVVWLFALAYSAVFLFFALFIFIFSVFIPLSLTGKISKYFLSTYDKTQFQYNDIQNSNQKSSPNTPQMTPVTINLSNNFNFFIFFSKFLYRNKNYLFYIAIIYVIMDITLAYTSPKQLITFLIFILIIWLLNAFNYSVDSSHKEILTQSLPKT